MNVAYNMDCMVAMKEFPDKFFDLAVVDPPYGGGAKADASETFNGAVQGRFGGRFEKYIEADRTGGTWAAKFGKHINNWDIAPPQEYFDELFRISKDQIIWGGNYFQLPPTRCFLIWKKLTISENFTMAMAEYAWTSFNSNAKVFEYPPQGKKTDPRFHPTQKPIELYDWIFSKYAKSGYKVIDTHLGSGSSRIAAYKAGLDFYGYEINEVYFSKQEERFAKFTEQTNLFN